MNGPIAQIAALTCHLNARQRGFAANPFLPGNSTSQFCEWIRFIRIRRDSPDAGEQWDLAACTPEEWIDSVAAGDFSREELIHEDVNDPRLSDRMSAGFIGGGGRWLLCVQRNGLSDCWQAHWQVGNRSSPERRIWRVLYAMIGERPAQNSALGTPFQISQLLIADLAEIETFARNNGLDDFASRFARARECLSSTDPLSYAYHRDLAPEGMLPLAAQQLLASCQVAWVFGGMGSWNDLSFGADDNALYKQLSQRLFDHLIKAVCVAANRSAAP